MAAREELLIAIKAVDMASSVLRNLDGQLDALGGTAGKTAAAVKGAGDSFGAFVRNAAAMGAGFLGFQTAAAGAAAFRGAAIDLNDTLEQTQIAFTTMLGSAERASSFVAGLQRFAQETPFEFPELLDASKRMMAFGFSAEQVIPVLTDVGNAAAALGGGRELVNRITLALGQMQAKSVVSGEEMRQLAEAHIPAWEMLAKAIGTDVPTAMKLVEQRAVPASTMLRAFQEHAQKRWGGMMALQALTYGGALSNVSDTLRLSVARGFKPFFEQLRAGAVDTANFLMSADFSRFTSGVAAASGATVRFLGTLGGFVGQTAPVWGMVAAVLALNVAVGAAPALWAGFVSTITRVPTAAMAIVSGLHPATVAVAALVALLMAIPALLDRIGSMSYEEYTAAASNPMIEGSWATPKLSKEAFNAQRSQAKDWAQEYKDTLTAPFRAVWEAIEMPGAAPAIDAVQTATTGVAQAALAASTSVDDLRDSLSAARDAASATREALSAARDDLQRFANAALPGEWALSARMGELDEQIASIKESQAQKRLDRLMRRPLRTPAQQLRALELQREIAGYQMVPYQNQHDQLRRLASDQITLSYEEAAAGILASKNKINALEAELRAREANIKAMETALKLAEDAAKQAATPQALEKALGPTVPLTVSVAQANRDYYQPPRPPSLAELNRDFYQPPAPVVAQAPAYVAPAPAPASAMPAKLEVHVSVTGVGQELAREIGQAVKGAVQTLVTGGGQSNAANKQLAGAY